MGRGKPRPSPRPTRSSSPAPLKPIPCNTIRLQAPPRCAGMGDAISPRTGPPACPGPLPPSTCSASRPRCHVLRARPLRARPPPIETGGRARRTKAGRAAATCQRRATWGPRAAVTTAASARPPPHAHTPPRPSPPRRGAAPGRGPPRRPRRLPLGPAACPEGPARERRSVTEEERLRAQGPHALHVHGAVLHRLGLQGRAAGQRDGMRHGGRTRTKGSPAPDRSPHIARPLSRDPRDPVPPPRPAPAHAPSRPRALTRRMGGGSRARPAPPRRARGAAEAIAKWRRPHRHRDRRAGGGTQRPRRAALSGVRPAWPRRDGAVSAAQAGARYSLKGAAGRRREMAVRRREGPDAPGCSGPGQAHDGRSVLACSPQVLAQPAEGKELARASRPARWPACTDSLPQEPLRLAWLWGLAAVAKNQKASRCGQSDKLR